MRDRGAVYEPDDAVAGAPGGDLPPASDLELPGAPPPDVLAALDVAQLVLAELASVDQHLHLDEQDGMLGVRVVQADGVLVRELSTVRALELLAREPGL